MPTIQAEPTPNPNSLKFTVPGESFRRDGVASFSSAEDAADHSLARRLFSIAGVEDVFIAPEFVTVSKHSEVDWAEATPQIKSVLAAHFDASSSNGA